MTRSSTSSRATRPGHRRPPRRYRPQGPGDLNLKAIGAPRRRPVPGRYGHPAPSAVRIRPSRARPSSSPATTSRTSKSCSSRPKERASTSTPTARCSLPTAIPASRSPHLVGNYGGAWQEQQQGIRQIPRRHPLHHQLHHEARQKLQGPPLHPRPGRLARRHAHRRPRLRAGHQGRRWPPTASRPTRRRRPS